MTHFSCEEATGYFELFIDNELTEDLRRKVQAHLEECPECQQRVRTLQEVDEMGRIDFYADPGEEYWKSSAARIMLNIPEAHPAGIPVRERIKSWFGTPAFARQLAFGALAAAVLFAGVRYSGVVFKSDGAGDLSAEREAGLALNAPAITEPGQSAAEPSTDATGTAAEPEAGSAAKKTADTGVNEPSRKTTDVPYIPRQMTVAPKPPTADANPPAVENPLLNKESSGKGETTGSETQSEMEDVAVSNGLQGTPAVRAPKIPQQGISALDRGMTQGVPTFQTGRQSSRSSTSSTRLSDMNTQPESRRQGVGSSGLSESELLQNKIILLEVLQTGKDRKIRDVALLQLDGLYQELLSRDPSAEGLREIKGFYSVYERDLIHVLGQEEYASRLERLK